MRYLLLLVSCVAWGQGYIPSYWNDLSAGQAASGSMVIDATGEKGAACGTVYIPDGVSRSIRKVGIGFNTVVKAGGSALTLSLQNVSTSAGPPAQPDGTPDETVSISNASISSSSFLLTDALSADRSVSNGDLLCSVIEFDGSGRIGSDSFQLATFVSLITSTLFASADLNTGSWAVINARQPVVLFEFSDGTYGMLDGASIFTSHSTTIAYNSGSSPDEYGLKFTVPTDGFVDGVTLYLTSSTSSNFDIVLYSGTTALATVSIDGNQWGTTTGTPGFVTIPRTAVSAGTTYYLGIKPTTANSLTLTGFTVANNAYLGAANATGIIRSSRTDAGAWSDTTTVVPAIKVRYTPTASSTGGGSFVVAQ